MEKYIKVNGWEFKLVNQGDWSFYECRGAVLYDDDHDQTPEPKLWDAAMKTRGYIDGPRFKSRS